MMSPSSTSENSKCGTEPVLLFIMSRSVRRSESFCTSFSSRLHFLCSSWSMLLNSLASLPSSAVRCRDGSVLLKLLFGSSRSHAGNEESPPLLALRCGDGVSSASRAAAAASSSSTRACKRSISFSIARCSFRHGATSSPSPAKSELMSTVPLPPAELRPPEVMPPPAAPEPRLGGSGSGPQSSAAVTASTPPPLPPRPPPPRPPPPRGAAFTRSVAITCAGVWPGERGGWASCRIVVGATWAATGLPSRDRERRCCKALRSSSGTVSS
mmetsp:Transcript_3644/g.9998  ORF Transcript_3644/g.9998 Transcript_3644/m.9998 type:complete len:269 (+) Transcript_3644:1231-2037(+)